MRTRAFVLALILALLIGLQAAGQAAQPLRFVVTFDPKVTVKPFTGRVLVMLGEAGGREPRLGPSWFDPQPFFGLDVKDWKPNTPLQVGDNALGFPGPLSKIAPGEYEAQAVTDLATDTHDIGNAPGNGYSAVVRASLDPQKGGEIALRIDRVIPARLFPESARVKLVDIVSPLLSTFHGRPIHERAAVILPEGYDSDANRRWPTVYIVPGFGGDHFMAPALLGPFGSRLPPGNIPAIRVVLDPDAHTGHHVFADSANNGPVGQALITELIPEIEKRFRAIPEPNARFLTGHSSGGWSTLWLQVTYPDFFGGTWSTSPDPVDFRDFQRIDIYAPGENMFTDRHGKPRPLARDGDKPVVFYRPFSDMETVLGHGGQLMSFEAVFSPRGADGRPKRLWDRKTGAIDPDVAKSWEKYDINLVLERNWATLGPKLRGKLHVLTGGMDTFYLEGAVKKLKETLERLGSDAEVEIEPGKDHGSILTPEFASRIGSEIMAQYRKRYPAPGH